MKAVKKTGLVPVQEGRRIFGVLPAVARELLAKNKVALAEIPDGIETIVVDAPPAKHTSKDVESTVIQIPDDWENLQWLRRVKLAKEIAGGDVKPVGDEKAADAADRVIREEIQRRAAVEKPA